MVLTNRLGRAELPDFMHPHKKEEWAVIYDARLEKRENGFRALSLPHKKNRKIGFFLLGVSIVSLLLFASPVILAETGYRINNLFRGSQKQKVILSGFGQILWLGERQISTPKNWVFSLVIPRLGINTGVVPSVNVKDENIYKTALKDGAAHAEDTPFPNEPGTTYIFGHSTNSILNISRYNAVFYPLQYIKEGDDIIVFYGGEIFAYKVTEKKLVDAEDISYLVPQTKEKKLVLQTCWPPGTTWKRLVVIANPIEAEVKSATGLDFKRI